MTLADGLTRIDAFLLDRVFQKLADRLGDRPSAFDVGISLELGAAVLVVAAYGALFAAHQLGWSGALWGAFNCASGLWFYAFMSRLRPLIRAGRPNPLWLMCLSQRLLALGFVIWSIVSAMQSGQTGALFYRFAALSNAAFVAGMYLMSCQPRPPGWRVARRQTVRAAAPSFT